MDTSSNDKIIRHKCQTGTLILAANSIGNPADMPLRSIEALRSADLLVFEEDRPARLALKTAGIHRHYLKLTEHCENETLQAVANALKNGQIVVYMSDQGMPALADPGSELLKIVYHMKSKLVVIPGPSSITAALAACPFVTNKFNFVGFLPRDAQSRQAFLKTLISQPGPYVILDAPYRLVPVLANCADIFGCSHPASLALDISGPLEEYLAGTLNSLLEQAKSLTEKLNFVLILENKIKSSCSTSKHQKPRK